MTRNNFLTLLKVVRRRCVRVRPCVAKVYPKQNVKMASLV